MMLMFLAVGLAAGVLSGLFGIGGGILIIPALIYFAKFPTKLALGTSLGAMLLPVGLLGAYAYYQQGNLNIKASMLIVWAFSSGPGSGRGWPSRSRDRRSSECSLSLSSSWPAGSGSTRGRVEMTTTDAGLAEIRLTSPAFEYGKPIPKVHTCDGDDASPILRWTGGPMARSYALVCDDPDAPRGTWDHWVLYNLPGGTVELT
ncbi:MAG TPA: TSUP family transporter, partial [Gemmatimonadales bacterium]|nr:TSUP family transporter [Gemmatimonadales bacterium]